MLYGLLRRKIVGRSCFSLVCLYVVIFVFAVFVMNRKPNSYHEKKDIFFLHMSNRPLDRVEECSVLSAVNQNPGHRIKLLVRFQIGLPHFLSSKESLKLQNLDPDSLFRPTPLHEWYKSGIWIVKNDSKKSERFISDAARVAYLSRFGGIYLDTDLISVKPVPAFRNAIGLQTEQFLNNAFLSFEANQPILQTIMEETARNFDSREKEIKYGPGLWTRLYNRDKNRFKSVTILKPHMVYPIPYRQAGILFEDADKTEVWWRAIKIAFFAHVWRNRLLETGSYTAEYGNNSLLYRLMRNYCPEVVQHPI